jgi:predicted transcriptional regulator
VIIKLFTIWAKLRRIRVPLTGEEVVVLRSIKNGCLTKEEIAQTIETNISEIERIIGNLRAKNTINETPLIEESAKGFFTSF